MVGLILPNQPRPQVASAEDFYRHAFGEGYEEGMQAGIMMATETVLNAVRHFLEEQIQENLKDWVHYTRKLHPTVGPDEFEETTIDLNEEITNNTYSTIDATLREILAATLVRTNPTRDADKEDQ